VVGTTDPAASSFKRRTSTVASSSAAGAGTVNLKSVAPPSGVHVVYNVGSQNGHASTLIDHALGLAPTSGQKTPDEAIGLLAQVLVSRKKPQGIWQA
jgi:hypothetical protein